MDYSVVIPVHNGARYIRRAVESALAQAPAGEVIVVDDGSTDGSAEAAAVDRRVRVMRQPTTLGPSEARNLGARLAHAPIIAFLDADDEWHPGKLQKQLALLRARPTLIAAFSDFDTVDPQGRQVGWQGGILSQLAGLGIALNRVDDTAYELAGPVREGLIRHTSFMHPSSVVIRRPALEKAGGFDPSYTAAEDLDLWIRLASLGGIGYVDECLVTIETRPDSQGHKTLNMCQHLIRLYSALPSRFPDASPDLVADMRRFVQMQYRTMGWLYLHESGDAANARRCYRSALRLGWSHGMATALAKAVLASLLPQRLWRQRV